MQNFISPYIIRAIISAHKSDRTQPSLSNIVRRLFVEEDVQDVAEGTSKIKGIVGQLSLYSRGKRPFPKRTDTRLSEFFMLLLQDAIEGTAIIPPEILEIEEEEVQEPEPEPTEPVEEETIDEEEEDEYEEYEEEPVYDAPPTGIRYESVWGWFVCAVSEVIYSHIDHFNNKYDWSFENLEDYLELYHAEYYPEDELLHWESLGYIKNGEETIINTVNEIKDRIDQIKTQYVTLLSKEKAVKGV